MIGSRSLSLTLVVLVATACTRVAADEPAPAGALDERTAKALERGLPLVTGAAMRYPEHRRCFSCHHQALPMLTIVAGRRAGIAANKDVLDAQAEFTHASFARELDGLRAGKGIGGRALTVGYGLWALSLADRPADEVTSAMVTYLVKTQHEDGHWQVQTVRPPMEESSETTTVIAAMGMRKYAPPDSGEQSELHQQVDAVLAKAKTWLMAAEPESTEDKAARLWGLHLFKASDKDLQSAREVLLAAQREDGGWPQLVEMQSDAYATGQTLCVLLSTGLEPTSKACRRGVKFLIKTQQDDGSWFVKSRSNPVQVLFDNGDPHGTDQFISTPATCWALTAIALSREKP